MTIIRYYRAPALSEQKTKDVIAKLKQISPLVRDVTTEICFHVELTPECTVLTEEQTIILNWLLGPGFVQQNSGKEQFSKNTHLKAGDCSLLIECGPRFNFSTADSSNSVSICQNVNLKNVKRLEVSKRYLIHFTSKPSHDVEEKLSAALYDRMTQCQYTAKNLPVHSFDEGLPPKGDSWHTVPVMKHGRKALEDINDKLGLAFDNWDLEFYTNLFQEKLKRDPTTVECFDLAQSNSEHSRHWFFKGRMIVDGKEEPDSLIDMIIETQKHSNPNNTIAFSDNSSAIKGYQHELIAPEKPGQPCRMVRKKACSDLIFTAETHNMPTAVAPFSGATTGTGGRIRDVQGVGRGGHTIAGTAGYSVGNLLIPGYDLPWEDKSAEYPSKFASPLDILIEASNGASDYGNKFGEPVVTGFANSYGLANADGEREEFVKPIMFSGGLGFMDSRMTKKFDPMQGMLLVKIGGPVYRIGVGGGAASSVEVQGDNKEELDFGAVQRGDAEMEQKLNRVVRACIELGERNPIQAIHDQGAGGNGNVLKELVEPNGAGAVIFVKDFKLGDPTITVLELWGAEYQENNALLCKPEDRDLLTEICERERCPVNFVGVVTGNGYVTLTEDKTGDASKYIDRSKRNAWGPMPFDLHLDAVLGKMPRKEFQLNRAAVKLRPLTLPAGLSVLNCLDRVLRLVNVGSKRFLTNKVDRCVTGLIAQQQCVGPLHTPLADCAVAAISHVGYEGVATSIGSQPVKGLLSPAAGARMTVAESLTNLVFAKVSSLADVKCSGNWMWAAKLAGEGAKLYDACRAMCDVMKQLKIAVDGGKDSLSMAARVADRTVKSPGTLVVSTYAPCPDVRVKVTPDLKAGSLGTDCCLLWIDLSGGKCRTGGSSLAQCFGQQGDNCPDLDRPLELADAFNVTQTLIGDGKILSGHDVSDGGLVTCLLEMAFAGLCGLNVTINRDRGDRSPIEVLFAEEVGWVLEVSKANMQHCLDSFKSAGVACYHVGSSGPAGLHSPVKISLDGTLYLESEVLTLVRIWEETSYHLELRQANSEAVKMEWECLSSRKEPAYNLTFDPDLELAFNKVSQPVRVAVIREEGSNGDREMIATLLASNFEVFDVTMQDLLCDKITLDQFRGVIFPGGFSYADTLGSAKGWAANILFQGKLSKQFDNFVARTNTFSLGVCNGCQLMALLGWISPNKPGQNRSPDILLDHNKSERFECRWNTVKIAASNSIMLHGMEGSVLGIWVAHGEGRFTFSNDEILGQLNTNKSLCMHYVDDYGRPTEVYPMNPNGSPGGVAAISSVDGRHLAMMPHPERCTRMVNFPWHPPSWRMLKTSPWQRMFDNAFAWCTYH